MNDYNHETRLKNFRVGKFLSTFLTQLKNIFGAYWGMREESLPEGSGYPEIRISKQGKWGLTHWILWYLDCFEIQTD